MPNDKNYCRVCGLRQQEPPWGEDGSVRSFGICDCCGTEFGYEDTTVAAIPAQRARWLSHGAPWANPAARPPNWDLNEAFAHS
jgi:hypothetical protein